MRREIRIPKYQLENIIKVYNLDFEDKKLLFQEFNNFIPQTSVRHFIKEISKRTKFPVDLLQNFFWFSHDMYILFLENGESYSEFFNNIIKPHIEYEYPEIKENVENFEDLEKFFSHLINLIDFEYFKVRNLDGINQINIGFSNIVSLYIFNINNNVVLIDAGYSMQYWKNAFYKALSELKINLKEIDYCIITHEHPDHTGLVADLKRANPEVKICLHKIAHELAKLRLKLYINNSIEETAKKRGNLLIKYGLPKEEVDLMIQPFGMGFDYVEPNLLLNDNDKIVDGELQIIHSPGHSVGHICVYYPREGIIFSGDHILSKITPHLGTLAIPGASEFNKKNNFENILEHYLRSLDRIDKLNSKIILPGHEQIIYYPHERITAIKNHHQNRLFDISRIIKNNPMPPFQIALNHFGDDLDQMNKILAISETLVHLDYLEFQNIVHKIEKDGMVLYWSEKPWKKIKYK
ncbi:MAG: MBL fold metallo-hydrolase [Candidatus Hodarchaeota archaeon]